MKEKEQSTAITSTPVKTQLRSIFVTPSRGNEIQTICIFVLKFQIIRTGTEFNITF